MNYFVIMFVCVISRINGRPTNENSDEDNNEYEVLPWPMQGNMFLLPRVLNLYEDINISIDMTSASVFDIVFMDETGINSTQVICSVAANPDTNTVAIQVGKSLPLEEDINGFAQRENGWNFNVWIRRKLNYQTNEDNVLEVMSNTFSDSTVFSHIDLFRVLQIIDKNENSKNKVNVTELSFLFKQNK